MVARTAPRHFLRGVLARVRLSTGRRVTAGSAPVNTSATYIIATRPSTGLHAAMTAALLLSLTTGCGTSWESLGDCPGLRKAEQRDECYAELLPELFRTEPDRADEIAQESVSDSQIRDFIYLTVTRRIDPSTLRWCDRIQEQVLEERCRVLVNRPHLHRDLVGAPPPGGERGKPTQELPGSPPR